ncbi:hypothetical protein Vau01_115670 [Virgisporangium aurantiacum]|uniref:Uncharacterized protein n=1 Tax=Virgisporangium aurantiacum TaxID=175570 RepID=A0A8J3ZHS1_9ACTN|nr:hypothetical protein Vau01_115670 [Virgisporangium aurantiacum]
MGAADSVGDGSGRGGRGGQSAGRGDGRRGIGWGQRANAQQQLERGATLVAEAVTGEAGRYVDTLRTVAAAVGAGSSNAGRTGHWQPANR